MNTFIWVTPSLRIDPEWPDCIADPQMAVDWIRRDAKTHIAYVPTIEVARDVLAIIGLDEHEIDDRIHFALTGEVLNGNA